MKIVTMIQASSAWVQGLNTRIDSFSDGHFEVWANDREVPRLYRGDSEEAAVEAFVASENSKTGVFVAHPY